MDIQKEILELKDIFTTKIAQIERDANTTQTSNDSPLLQQFTSFKKFVLDSLSTLQRQIELLAKVNDHLDMQGRQKFLLLHGVAEEKNEDAAAVVVNQIQTKLKLTNINKSNMSRCHRLGSVRVSQEKPRPLLIKFRDIDDREAVWSKKTLFKGTGITLTEFLTKIRQQAFVAARQRFGISKSWTRGGFVFVLDAAGNRHKIVSEADLLLISEPEDVVVTTLSQSQDKYSRAPKTTFGTRKRTAKK